MLKIVGSWIPQSPNGNIGEATSVIEGLMHLHLASKSVAIDFDGARLS